MRRARTVGDELIIEALIRDALRWEPQPDVPEAEPYDPGLEPEPEPEPEPRLVPSSLAVEVDTPAPIPQPPSAKYDTPISRQVRSLASELDGVLVRMSAASVPEEDLDAIAAEAASAVVAGALDSFLSAE